MTLPSQVQTVGLEFAGDLRPHGDNFDAGHHDLCVGAAAPGSLINSRAKGETGKGRGALFLLAVVPILSGTACACFTPTRLVRLSTGGPSGGFPIAAL